MAALILVSGVPGSGKTEFASYLSTMHDECCSVAADDFMVNEDGQYEYDKDRIAECHSKCQARVRGFLFRSPGLIPFSETDATVVVHNTFVRQWEIEPYRQMAEEAGVPIFVVEMRQRFENTHDVPDDVVSRMSRNFEREEDK